MPEEQQQEIEKKRMVQLKFLEKSLKKNIYKKIFNDIFRSAGKVAICSIGLSEHGKFKYPHGETKKRNVGR